MKKIKMLLLCFQVSEMLKGVIHRNSEYIEAKKILDTIRNKITESRTSFEDG